MHRDGPGQHLHHVGRLHLDTPAQGREKLQKIVPLLFRPRPLIGEGQIGKPFPGQRLTGDAAHHVGENIGHQNVVSQHFQIVAPLRFGGKCVQHRQLSSPLPHLPVIGGQHLFYQPRSHRGRRRKEDDLRLHLFQRARIVVQYDRKLKFFLLSGQIRPVGGHRRHTPPGGLPQHMFVAGVNVLHEITHAQYHHVPFLSQNLRLLIYPDMLSSRSRPPAGRAPRPGG